MKKTLVVIGLFILLGGIYAWIALTKTGQLVSNPSAESFVTTVTGPDTSNYGGKITYEYEYDTYTLFEPSKYNLDKYGFNPKYKERAVTLENGKYLAFIYTANDGMRVDEKPGEVTTVTAVDEKSYLVIVNTTSGEIIEYPFPSTIWTGTEGLSRAGNNLFLHYLDYFPKPGDKEGKHAFYMFDTQSRTFRALEIDPEIFEGMTNYKFQVAVNPKNESNFAIVFCNHMGWNDCDGSGLALSDSRSIKKLFNIKNGYPHLGWQDDQFFVKVKDTSYQETVYVVDPAKVFE